MAITYGSAVNGTSQRIANTTIDIQGAYCFDITATGMTLELENITFSSSYAGTASLFKANASTGNTIYIKNPRFKTTASDKYLRFYTGWSTLAFTDTVYVTNPIFEGNTQVGAVGSTTTTGGTGEIYISNLRESITSTALYFIVIGRGVTATISQSRINTNGSLVFNYGATDICNTTWISTGVLFGNAQYPGDGLVVNNLSGAVINIYNSYLVGEYHCIKSAVAGGIINIYNSTCLCATGSGGVDIVNTTGAINIDLASHYTTSSGTILTLPKTAPTITLTDEDGNSAILSRNSVSGELKQTNKVNKPGVDDSYGNAITDRANTLVPAYTSMDRNFTIGKNGNLTSFTFYAYAAAGSIKIKVFRDGGTTWDYIGQSENFTVSATGSQTKTLATPIAVLNGDYVAFHSTTSENMENSNAGGTSSFIAGDQVTSVAKASWTASTMVASLSVNINTPGADVTRTATRFIDGSAAGEGGILQLGDVTNPDHTTNIYGAVKVFGDDAPATNEVPVFNGTKIIHQKITTSNISDTAGILSAQLATGIDGAKLLAASVPSTALTGYVYVPRNLSAWDFTEAASFGTTGSWQADGLDLSSIVPSGAVAVHLIMLGVDDSATSYFGIRPNSTPAGFNQATIYTGVSAVDGSWLSFILPIDSNRLMDYYASANMTYKRLSVAGWFI